MPCCVMLCHALPGSPYQEHCLCEHYFFSLFFFFSLRLMCSSSCCSMTASSSSCFLLHSLDKTLVLALKVGERPIADSRLVFTVGHCACMPFHVDCIPPGSLPLLFMLCLYQLGQAMWCRNFGLETMLHVVLVKPYSTESIHRLYKTVSVGLADKCQNSANQVT